MIRMQGSGLCVLDLQSQMRVHFFLAVQDLAGSALQEILQDRAGNSLQGLGNL